MEKQFNYLRDIGKKYHEFSTDDERLLTALSELGDDTLHDIINKYTSKDRSFQPVNMLRAKTAMILLDRRVRQKDIEDIKMEIREKNKVYFAEFPEHQLEGLEEYLFSKKRDVFTNWQRLWSIYHVFFFRAKTKQTVQLYLEQICDQLMKDLELQDYKSHWVDFSGANNFGTYKSWVALYPEQKESHRDAYQIFILFKESPEAGYTPGHSVKKPKPASLVYIDSYEEMLKALIDIKEEVQRLNTGSRNYFKFSPGAQAEHWDWFYQEKIIGIGYNEFELGDISEINSRNELIQRAGLSEGSRSNQIWNIWLFKSAKKGDVVFVNHGRDKVLGIGIITGEYTFNKEHNHSHQRSVEWLTDKVYEYKTASYKDQTSLFRADTFSPTKVSDFLLSEYVRLYPELEDVFEQHHLQFENIDIQENKEEEFTDKESINNFWWLNANPKIWTISSFNEGDTQTYTARNERGNKRRIYQYFEAVERGDLTRIIHKHAKSINFEVDFIIQSGKELI